MLRNKLPSSEDLDPQETLEWLEALDEVIDEAGPDRASYLLERLADRARVAGAAPAYSVNTPYINTIPPEEEVPYPGDRAIERRLKSLIRWNALAMVVRANKYDSGIGGHISSYASLATLLEVGFNHFFRASYGDQPGDLVYFQGHSSPGVYARAYLEGRLNEKHLENFRHELRDHPGLSSYPHPWLMPHFWQFPTVSMGLGPINAIYQARFMRYLENRGLIEPTPRKIWAFLGDGETDEPETTGALRIAANEKLDNLIFVVNCNLQRLDGPVRGNGKVIQELEALFAGCGWNVIKVIWGSDWDELLARDRTGLLVKRMNECLDGDYQTLAARDGAYIRKEFFGKYPELLELVADKTDEQLTRLRRGGHDPQKVYNAYKRAVEHKGGPTVILAKTIKGYGLGEAGEGRNITHQQKKLNEQEMEYFCRRFEIPITEERIHTVSFYRPPEDSPEIRYLHQRRKELGGYLPSRNPVYTPLPAPPLEYFADTLTGSQGREVSTTMAFVRVLTLLLRHPELGRYVIPIIPDEARTFGMESLFRQIGIYASQGQLYRPVDQEMFLYYKESKSGQILEEGITEAGAMASFTAAGTSYANYNLPLVPFYIYYSMFGFQRVGDLMWAFADARGKGFLVGATAGRTTLAGEGLQHQDGHSHLLMSVLPTCAAYDPAYAYEITVIVQDGIRRMYQENEDLFYYLTVYNENYAQPPMPEGVREGILKGIYRYRRAEKGKAVVQLFGSGPILNEALKAQQILAERYGVPADVWSVTSYTELRREALEVERWNRLHPAEPERRPYLLQVLEDAEGPIIAATDYMKAVADQVAPWLAGRLVSLGTDGFGRSDNREHLREFFEVNASSIAAAALSRLAREGKFDPERAQAAFADLEVEPQVVNPAVS
ncbi:MAG TPA: pyruvate dehydrogenase (acetyl-transferring), homodimeric type [Bryobacteraceae bacterium]|nr:pyruvate dehydrogenase (acetyl-transferring), homodimeric type [Bryobacteraceae bacterium]HPU72753.1 pyruvate dehydrogenase (acetyl-transferring), homodimeric type [Bryobacteraceae bacterium]